VLQALAQAGWGIVWVAAFHIVPLVASTYGWLILIPGKKRPTLSMFTYYMWVRTAINLLMPVARVGGEIACVRMMIAHGMRKNVAIAITVVEVTLSIAAIFLFVAIGILLFALRVSDKDIVTQLAWGFVLSTPLLGAMVLVQRIGFFGLLLRLFRAVFRDKWGHLAGDAARLDRAVTVIYRRTGRAVVCTIWQFAAWALGSVEIWMALVFLGHPLSWTEAIMIESLIQGSASIAFAVPGALGVQEAGFLVFGGMLGLPHETAAALALIRRGRDLLFFAPALVFWQLHEGKRLLKK
jgi:putative membrane protein